MASPAIALLYPPLLASVLINSNYSIFADDYGIPYLIDTTEPQLTPTITQQIKDDANLTTFHLYTRNNPRHGQRIIIDNLESVKNSFWNPTHPTRMITHGWRGNCDISTCTSIRNSYLRADDYNVILIDWRDAAGDLWYWKVVNSVPLVAKRIAHLIDFLQTQAGLDPTTTKIVGHSLGGHVAGLSARFAASEIAEVIALDPARPSFESTGPGKRVDKTDASHVQVIHTNAGMLGLEEAVGTSDFYPNNGKSQPGCGMSDWIGTCAHARSYEYYAESVTNPTGFRAGEVFMGGPSLDTNARGKYTLQTASKPPYALG